MTTRNGDFFARLGFTTWVLVVVVLSMCHASSIPAATMQHGGWFFTVLLLVAGALLLVDIVVNDLMPDRYVFTWGLKWRHWVYPMASFSFASHLFVAEQAYKSVQISALVLYGSMAVFGLTLSFRNLFHVRGRACSER
ncbi:TPA: hypothetical protein ACYLN4_002710 [Burkholderia lata]